MRFDEDREITAEYLLRFVNSKLGLWVLFALSVIIVLVWFLAGLFHSSSVNHSVWYWLAMPLVGLIGSVFLAFTIGLACIAALSLWIETRGKSRLKRIIIMICGTLATIALMGFMFGSYE